MNQTFRLRYLLIALLALAPAGVCRLLLWQMAWERARVQAGEKLFKHDWKPNDPLSPGGDGLGPVYNATSCVACHNQGGPGGGGGLEHNVTTFTVREPGKEVRQGVVHAYGVHRPETLKDVHPTLPDFSLRTLEQVVRQASAHPHANRSRQFSSVVQLSQRNTPALFGAKLIDDIPERVILAGARSQQARWGVAPADAESVPVGRALRLANGRVGRFGWKAQMASLSEFVQAACANELGLGNPGQAQPVPLYEKGTPSQSPGLDLTLEQCYQLTAFCASLPKPVERLPKDVTADQAALGKKLFHMIGCAECHTPKLGSADGIYSDLLLHRMGQGLVGGGAYGQPSLPVPDSPGDDGPSPSEWRTPPLWGVADSAPYLHDGRAATLEEALHLHGGQARRSAERFAQMSAAYQGNLIAFLRTLRAP
jgi:CxxC motif-containing protein (DUF1111 family)